MSTASPRRPVVLLLDDEVALTGLLSASLGREFEIEIAATVEEALLLLGARKFDALLCDHMLPGGRQGLEFLVTAQQVQPSAKRILMTGYMNPELISRSTEVAGLSAVLLKPASLQEFRQVLHDALGLSA